MDGKKAVCPSVFPSVRPSVCLTVVRRPEGSPSRLQVVIIHGLRPPRRLHPLGHPPRRSPRPLRRLRPCRPHRPYCPRGGGRDRGRDRGRGRRGRRGFYYMFTTFYYILNYFLLHFVRFLTT